MLKQSFLKEWEDSKAWSHKKLESSLTQPKESDARLKCGSDIQHRRLSKKSAEEMCQAKA